MKINESQIIVFDADVIIHFHVGGQILQLAKIFPKNKKIVLDIVANELRKHKAMRPLIDKVFEYKIFEEVESPTQIEFVKEYAHLTSSLIGRGKGESACMAYCKLNKDIIASSNLRDIANYCKLHSIGYLTTMDFVFEAYTSKLWSKDDCNQFIKTVINNNSKLPFNNFEAYLKHIEAERKSDN